MPEIIKCFECGSSWNWIVAIYPRHTPGCVICCDRTPNQRHLPPTVTEDDYAALAELRLHVPRPSELHRRGR